MKKSVLAMSALSLALVSGVATANVNDANLQANNVRFLGAVTDTTCNLVPHVNGSVTNVVNVGTVAKNAKGTPVEFSLKPDGKNDCSSIVDTNNPANSKTAHIAFMGALTEQGLSNQSGTATDANLEIHATNSTQQNEKITQSNDVRQISGENLMDKGATFTATLHGGQVAGDFQSAIAYQVSYQ
ncbi:fimbrial protein PefA [Salmonella enterica subsp. enterica serovar Reading]|nr:fimbrial protein PefA [Salmonella enterica]EBH8769738.1 fimbrial protein PefA [Salmonella enterica subsp. enterica serovar Freetown]EBY8607802.1 fimbrial protein PefA [Salmonella enterica subsp. enterica serovar Reading]EDR7594585.1 fimbrial protein PefA [Salmonella enterica subsp. enterica]EBH8792197.1 fimbrial protein PefA [Salmonella enterica subsp. enterica serovar Freetown]